MCFNLVVDTVKITYKIFQKREPEFTKGQQMFGCVIAFYGVGYGFGLKEHERNGLLVHGSLVIGSLVICHWSLVYWSLVHWSLVIGLLVICSLFIGLMVHG